MKIISLVLRGNATKELRAEVLSRVEVFSDCVCETGWKQMEENCAPERGDYVFILKDTDVIDDVSKVLPFVKSSEGAAFAVKRYEMWEGESFRVDSGFAPKFEYQLFPYMPGAALYEHGLHLPTYTYSLHFIRDPHLTILSFEHYGQHDNTKATTEPWTYSFPEAAASQGRD